ncbi:MAG: hypothetical protein K2R98_10825 [Gemmataceae bacterium]|nr:hypothetical protein [Gemmataceae bacterium]
MSNATPEIPARPAFLIREAGASDLAHVRTWLPEALGGTPAARLTIAVDAATEGVAGVAALRVFDDQVGRFLLYVDPVFRRRGGGTAAARPSWNAFGKPRAGRKSGHC